MEETEEQASSHTLGGSHDAAGIHMAVPTRPEAAELWLTALVNSSDDAILSKTLTGIITSWNPAAERIYGYAAAEIIGQSVTLIIPPERLHEFNEIMRQLRQGQRIEHFETVRVRRDGVRIEVAVTISPIIDAQRQIIGASTIARDISERKQIEAERAQLLQALDESHRLFQRIAETSPDALYVFDLDTKRTTYASPRCEQVIGYTADELKALDDPTAAALWHPDDWPSRAEHMRKRRELADGEIYEFEYRVLQPDGTYRWLWARTGVFARNADGRVRQVIGITQDITERKRTEQALHASEQKFAKVFHVGPLAITITKLADGRLIEVNETFVQLTGYTRAEALGHTPVELGLWVEPAQRAAGLAQVRAGHFRRNTEARFRMKDGNIRTCLISAELIEINGEPCVMTVLTDITERKQAEEALHELNATLERRVEERTAELQRSNRELDQFAYVASHDLRSPLRGIEHLVNFISEDAADRLPEASNQHLALLRGRVKRMDALLTDLLAYSRAGRQKHPIERVNPAALVRSVVELLAPPPGFLVRVVEPMPTLITERIPLESILRNLIDNAIKHHHCPASGQVTIAAQVIGSLLEFTVADNGPGIDPTFHARIFEIFQTLKPRDQVEGSGIGLTLVRRLVESRGGQIQVESSPSQGATFRFTWPVSS